MTLNGKRVLILLGGQWHDFDGFADAVSPLLTSQGMQVEATYDLEKLSRLDQSQYDAVLSYTCFTSDEGGSQGPSPDRLTQAQLDSLVNWVRSGGALLAAHAATVIGASDPALGELPSPQGSKPSPSTTSSTSKSALQMCRCTWSLSIAAWRTRWSGASPRDAGA
jgi:hypothetical protein